jgi:hypothetical protein
VCVCVRVFIYAFPTTKTHINMKTTNTIHLDLEYLINTLLSQIEYYYLLIWICTGSFRKTGFLGTVKITFLPLNF